MQQEGPLQIFPGLFHLCCLPGSVAHIHNPFTWWFPSPSVFSPKHALSSSVWKKLGIFQIFSSFPTP